MKTTIDHNLFGKITYDDSTGQVSVQKGDLAERLTWLLKPKNSALLGQGYHPDRFMAAVHALGIASGIEDVKREGEYELPEGAVY